MKIDVRLSAIRRWLCSALATYKPISWQRKVVYALAIFSISFAVKSLHAVDLSPVMYTTDQPAAGMAVEYDTQAVAMMNGGGILLPSVPKPSDTTLLEHPPGYAIFLSVLYSVVGRNYFRVQLIQNAINSISPVMLFLIAGTLFGWRVGPVSGVFAGVWHHLSYYSNFILPDSLCALPVLICVYLLIRDHRRADPSVWIYVLAGALIGVSVWLRANALLMAPFLGFVLTSIAARRAATAFRVAVMMVTALLTIAPITIRDYILYKSFVPVQIGMGLNLWTGIGQEGGQRFCAQSSDAAVALNEAELYGRPDYAPSWYTPDGITRDHNRVRKSLNVITGHPVWYADAVLSRMLHMFNYTADASLVSTRFPTTLTTVGNQDRQDMEVRLARGEKLGPEESLSITAGRWLIPGQALAWLRPLVRAMQRLEKETALVFIIIGVVGCALVSRRRTFLLGMVAAYYLLFQSLVHTEFRYILLMHYFVFAFAGAGWVLAAVQIRNLAVNLYGFLLSRRAQPAASLEAFDRK